MTTMVRLTNHDGRDAFIDPAMVVAVLPGGEGLTVVEWVITLTGVPGQKVLRTTAVKGDPLEVISALGVAWRAGPVAP